MRFLLAVHVTLVIKDKNKLDVHTPYTDMQLHMNNRYIHTAIIPTNTTLASDRKAFSLMPDILSTWTFSKSLQ